MYFQLEAGARDTNRMRMKWHASVFTPHSRKFMNFNSLDYLFLLAQNKTTRTMDKWKKLSQYVDTWLTMKWILPMGEAGRCWWSFADYRDNSTPFAFLFFPPSLTTSATDDWWLGKREMSSLICWRLLSPFILLLPFARAASVRRRVSATRRKLIYHSTDKVEKHFVINDNFCSHFGSHCIYW